MPRSARIRRLVVVTIGFVTASGTASAHGSLVHGGAPVAFGVVVGLPVAAGVGGGAIAVLRVRPARPYSLGRRTGSVLGIALAALGLTFLVAAVTTSRPLGLVGGSVGALSVLLITRRGGHDTRGCHAGVTLGAVSSHRLLEGFALGALYSAGAPVGLFGAILLACHTALETAVVGGLYAPGPTQNRALGAILLVQAGYAGGAVVGIGMAGALPSWTRALALAAAGGALLVVGLGETEHSIATREPASAP